VFFFTLCVAFCRKPPLLAIQAGLCYTDGAFDPKSPEESN
jgi:hypothetical protein